MLFIYILSFIILAIHKNTEVTIARVPLTGSNTTPRRLHNELDINIYLSYTRIAGSYSTFIHIYTFPFIVFFLTILWIIWKNPNRANSLAFQIIFTRRKRAIGRLTSRISLINSTFSDVYRIFKTCFVAVAYFYLYTHIKEGFSFNFIIIIVHNQ